MILYSKTGLKCTFEKLLVYKNKSESKIYISFHIIINSLKTYIVKNVNSCYIQPVAVNITNNRGIIRTVAEKDKDKVKSCP